jgi:hypothetical protein
LYLHRPHSNRLEKSGVVLLILKPECLSLNIYSLHNFNDKRLYWFKNGIPARKYFLVVRARVASPRQRSEPIKELVSNMYNAMIMNA